MSRIKRWNTSQLKWIIVVRCWVRNELAATPQGPWSRPSVKQWTGASETSGKETTSTWRVTLFTTLISSIESSRPRWTKRRRFAFNRFKSFASCEWSAWMKLFKVTRPFVSCFNWFAIAWQNRYDASLSTLRWAAKRSTLASKTSSPGAKSFPPDFSTCALRNAPTSFWWL